MAKVKVRFLHSNIADTEPAEMDCDSLGEALEEMAGLGTEGHGEIEYWITVRGIVLRGTFKQTTPMP